VGLGDDQVFATQTLGIVIVMHHDPAIGRQVHIHFYAVGTLCPGQSEGGQRVLRRLARGTAVRDDVHGGDRWLVRGSRPLSNGSYMMASSPAGADRLEAAEHNSVNPGGHSEVAPPRGALRVWPFIRA